MDLTFIRTGAPVFWMDPGIVDFEPEERLEQATRQYTIIDESYREKSPENGDETVLISDGNGESEVRADELHPKTRYWYQQIVLALCNLLN